MYKGASASFAREITYSTLCLGLYEPYKNMLGASHTNAPIYLQLVAGMLAGMTSAMPTVPADLIKVRMQADTGTPKSLRWHINQIYAYSGLIGFYTGMKETVLRAGIARGSSLATYDHVKHLMLR